MNLAYMYSHGGAPDRAAALAYAEGAVTAVPEWHYVRDILSAADRGASGGRAREVTDAALAVEAARRNNRGSEAP